MDTLQSYKCPACGGAIMFDSANQQMKCPFCNASYEMEALKAHDDQLKGTGEPPSEMNWDVQTNENWQGGQDGVLSYICNSCGGEIISDRTTAATSCPYCDNPVVMMEQFSNTLRPDYVIPFKLDKAAAKAALTKHISKKRLVPKIFKDQNHIDEIQGVYVPFWLFNADADASIRYRATKIRTWSDSSRNYTETSYFQILREGNIGFDRIPVDGSSKMPDDLMESIEPYDYKDMMDFQTAFLSGFLADKYDVGADESVGRANQRVKKSTVDAFASTIQGYTGVTPEYTRIRLENGAVKYAMLPVWLLNTTWKNKKYTFAMNGQTGKIVGDLPLDKRAYLRWLGIWTAIFGAAAFAAQVLMLFFG